MRSFGNDDGENKMKKKSITGIIVVALFIIGIIAALIVYKKMQMVPEKSQVGEEPETY